MNNQQPGLDEANFPMETTTQNPPMTSSPAQNQPEPLSAKLALELFVQDPVGFVQHIVNNAAETHLADLKEEAELQGALNVFRKTHPEFSQFEPFIMQEVVALIQNNPENAAAPWSQLLENAMNNFKQKFADTVKNVNLQTNSTPQQPPSMEAATNRIQPNLPPSFTREQIAGMSLNDFLRQEAAINAALKEGRIR